MIFGRSRLRGLMLQCLHERLDVVAFNSPLIGARHLGISRGYVQRISYRGWSCHTLENRVRLAGNSRESGTGCYLCKSRGVSHVLSNVWPQFRQTRRRCRLPFETTYVETTRQSLQPHRGHAHGSEPASAANSRRDFGCFASLIAWPFPQGLIAA